MYLVLICFHNFFNKNATCPFVTALLDNAKFIALLDINNEEKKCYQFFTQGPPDIAENADELLWHFSAKNDNKFDTSLRYLFVNVLAVVLGLPRGSNHLYTRVFTPEVLSSSVRGPGSTYPNERDCGYFIEATGELTNRFDKYANIMGGSRLYRLGLNTMTWAALCVPLFVDFQKYLLLHIQRRLV
jgi:hypothetical protein